MDHHNRSKSENKGSEVEEKFQDQLFKEYEKYKQEDLGHLENLEDSEGLGDDYLEQRTPLGTFKRKKTKQRTRTPKKEFTHGESSQGVPIGESSNQK